MRQKNTSADINVLFTISPPQNKNTYPFTKLKHIDLAERDAHGIRFPLSTHAALVL